MEILKAKKTIIVAGAVILSLFLLTAASVMIARAAYAGKIYPNVYVGDLDISGLTAEQAVSKLQQRVIVMNTEGIKLRIDEDAETVTPASLGVQLSIEDAVNKAMQAGRDGTLLGQIGDLVDSQWREISVQVPLQVDDRAWFNAMADLKNSHGNPGTDIRLKFEGEKVVVLTDVKPGHTIDIDALGAQLKEQLSNLKVSDIEADLKYEEPKVDEASAPAAVSQAERVMSQSIKLLHDRHDLNLSKARIGTLLVSEAVDNKLIVRLDKLAVSEYVAELAGKINNIPQVGDINIDANGKIIDFVPPAAGEVLLEEKTVDLITAELQKRLDGEAPSKESVIDLPVVIKAPNITGSATELGVEELIGIATTPFKGSPTNRRLNIANGTKFLNGILLAPDETFSTIQTLGVIDNTTGYLPELVIKGDRTIPEFGGGLCQVSTTLFRAVLDAGMPVVERRNHSYRVGYYERDASGRFIGPGLDATIYDPAPDFKFKNDTGAHILIRGYVKGDYITFELYGKKDGRVAEVDGPHTLKTVPAGEPIYTETDTLEAGVIKKVETAHAGGTATATYTVKYADGRVETQKFDSYYRPWPERYLVGVGTDPSLYKKELSSPATSTPSAPVSTPSSTSPVTN